MPTKKKIGLEAHKIRPSSDRSAHLSATQRSQVPNNDPDEIGIYSYTLSTITSHTQVSQGRSDGGISVPPKNQSLPQRLLCGCFSP